ELRGRGLEHEGTLEALAIDATATAQVVPRVRHRGENPCCGIADLLRELERERRVSLGLFRRKDGKRQAREQGVNLREELHVVRTVGERGPERSCTLLERPEAQPGDDERDAGALRSRLGRVPGLVDEAPRPRLRPGPSEIPRNS